MVSPVDEKLCLLRVATIVARPVITGTNYMYPLTDFPSGTRSGKETNKIGRGDLLPLAHPGAIMNSLRQQQGVFLVLLDLSAAFDTGILVNGIFRNRSLWNYPELVQILLQLSLN